MIEMYHRLAQLSKRHDAKQGDFATVTWRTYMLFLKIPYRLKQLFL